MADFLSRLIDKANGRAAVARPVPRSIFAPEPSLASNFLPDPAPEEGSSQEAASFVSRQTQTNRPVLPPRFTSGQTKFVTEPLAETTPGSVSRPTPASMPQPTKPLSPNSPEGLARPELESKLLSPEIPPTSIPPIPTPPQPKVFDRPDDNATLLPSRTEFQTKTEARQPDPLSVARPARLEEASQRSPVNEPNPPSTEEFVLVPVRGPSFEPSNFFQNQNPVQIAPQPRRELSPYSAGLEPENTSRLDPLTSSGSETAPTIEVTIGRIEVRAVMPPTEAPSAPARPAPKMSLDEYLRQTRRELK